MPRDKRKDAIEAAGIVAVIASLLFLAFEVRQTNRIAVASIEIGLRNGYSEINRGVYSDNGIAELLVKGIPDGHPFALRSNVMTNTWSSIKPVSQASQAWSARFASINRDSM